MQIREKFFALAEQTALIQNCHAGIVAYQDVTHASSGIIPLVLTAGRPVICTPFEYARAKRNEISEIILADDFGADALQRAILEFWMTRERYLNATKSIHEYAKRWHWNVAAKRYLDEFRRVLDGT